MADQVTVGNEEGQGDDYVVSTDDAGASGHVQRVKLAYSADGVATHATVDADGVLVNLGTNNDVSVTGTVAVTQSGTWDEVGINDSGNSITVDDGGSSLTVDGTVGVSGTVAVTQSGTWDEIGINDSGNSITVDNGGTFAVQADTELTTADLDTGAGTDTRAVVGLVGSKSGGGALIPGDATAGLKVDLGADNDVTVTGTVAVTQSGTWDEIGINDSGNSITVDNGGTFVTQENGAALTALQVIDNPVLVDDAAFTPASSSVMMAGFQFDNVGTDSVDEGDAGAARMSANRNVLMNIRDAAGNERGANVNSSNQLSVSVDNTVTVGSHAVTNAGTFVVQENGAALTSLQLIDDAIVADDAGFTPATTKVMMAGFEFDDSAPDSVNEGDAGAARMSANRNVYTTLRDAAGNERGANVTASNALVVDGSAVTQPTKETRSGTGTTSQVSDTASSTTILASNANRLGASIQNDSSAVLYLKCGTTASATDYTVRLVQYGYWEVPANFTGRIDGIWATDPNNGAARVTEYT